MDQFDSFSMLNDEDLPLTLETYKIKGVFMNFDVEQFWIDMLEIMEEKNTFHCSQIFLLIL